MVDKKKDLLEYLGRKWQAKIIKMIETGRREHGALWLYERLEKFQKLLKHAKKTVLRNIL